MQGTKNELHYRIISKSHVPSGSSGKLIQYSHPVHATDRMVSVASNSINYSSFCGIMFFKFSFVWGYQTVTVWYYVCCGEPICMQRICETKTSCPAGIPPTSVFWEGFGDAMACNSLPLDLLRKWRNTQQNMLSPLPEENIKTDIMTKVLLRRTLSSIWSLCLVGWLVAARSAQGCQVPSSFELGWEKCS